SPSPPPMADVEATVLTLVSDACDISASAVDVHTDLMSIGFDSMMSIEIFGGLRAAFPGTELDSHVLSFCTTVADICREVSFKFESPTKVAASLTVTEAMPSPRTLLDESTDGAATPDALGVIFTLGAKANSRGLQMSFTHVVRR
ncbi:hypothetical protein DFH07DRAFT_753211, partial [Mycena maculata]